MNDACSFCAAVAGLWECACVLASLLSLLDANHYFCSEVVGHFDPIGLERIHRFHKPRSRIAFKEETENRPQITQIPQISRNQILICVNRGRGNLWTNWLSMQRCRRNDLSAVKRKVMWRRVRPTLPHTNAISQMLSLAKAFSLPKSDARTHRTPTPKPFAKPHFPHTAGRQCKIQVGRWMFGVRRSRQP
jgi:hypothetical protein